MTAVEPVSLDPRAAERANVVTASRKRPIWLVRHGLAMAEFLAGYTVSRARRRFASDVHGVGKKRPAWLPTRLRSLAPTLAAPLFPKYGRAAAQLPVIDSAAGPDIQDPESLFAEHRWSQCVMALFGTDADALNAVEQSVAWLTAAPDRSSAAWEPYSTAERVANLGVLLAACPTARSGVDPGRLVGFLATSLGWIEDHLEYYGPRRTNNHILNDARALVIGGAILRDSHAVETGMAIFARLGPELVQPNGFLRERSSHYQAIVTNWLLDASHFAAACDLSPTAEGQRALLTALTSRVSDATATMWPFVEVMGSHIGDVSPDSPPAVTSARLDVLYPGWRRRRIEQATLVDDWLLFSRGDHRLFSCVIDGRFPPPYPTHGHSDVAHFTWAWQGTGVLADAGRYRYTKDPQSLAQADARGHNVLLVDGFGPVSESLARGGHWHLRPYSDAMVKTRVLPDGFSVEHNGFTRRRGIGKHIRTTRVDEQTLSVVDAFGGHGTVTIDWLWHFHPRFSPETTTPGAVSDGTVRVEYRCECPSAARTSLHWETYAHSSVYGQQTLAPVLRMTAIVCLPYSATTTFVVSPCAE